MHGCGVKFNTDDPGSMRQAGQFIDDEYVGPSNVCSVAAAQQAAQQAMAAAHLASGLQVCCCRHHVHHYVHLKIVFYNLPKLYFPSVHSTILHRKRKVLKAFGFDAMIHLKVARLPAMQVPLEAVVTFTYHLAHGRMHQDASSSDPCFGASIRVAVTVERCIIISCHSSQQIRIKPSCYSMTHCVK